MESIISQIASKHYDNALVNVDINSCEEKVRLEKVTNEYLAQLDGNSNELGEAVGAFMAETQMNAYTSGMRLGAQLIWELLMTGGARL